MPFTSRRTRGAAFSVCSRDLTLLFFLNEAKKEISRRVEISSSRKKKSASQFIRNLFSAPSMKQSREYFIKEIQSCVVKNNSKQERVKQWRRASSEEAGGVVELAAQVWKRTDGWRRNSRQQSFCVYTTKFLVSFCRQASEHICGRHTRVDAGQRFHREGKIVWYEIRVLLFWFLTLHFTLFAAAAADRRDVRCLLPLWCTQKIRALSDSGSRELLLCLVCGRFHT